MKKIITFVFTISSFAVCAQKLEPTETEALLIVSVVDNNQHVLEGEKVFFTSAKNKKEYFGITQENGKFEILVPEGDKYKVGYKAFTNTEDYSELTIPSEEGMINFEFKLIIQAPKLFTLDNVFFNTGKSTLQTEPSKALDELAEYMSLKKKLIVEIAGHTDNVGNKDANQLLSKQRANTVRNYLIKKGIAESRIIAQGYGDTQPIDDNTTEEGRQKNRRTEVRTLNDDN